MDALSMFCLACSIVLSAHLGAEIANNLQEIARRNAEHRKFMQAMEDFERVFNRELDIVVAGITMQLNEKLRQQRNPNDATN